MANAPLEFSWMGFPQGIHRAIRVPSDPPVRVGEEAPPDGVPAAALDAIWRAVEGFYRTGLHPAFQICIYQRDRVVLHRALGHAHGNGPDDAADADKIPLELDTPFLLYSASKAITAFLVLKLDELGVLHIEDRVAQFIPEFAQNGKDEITIRQILSHRAGIPMLPPGVDMTDAEEVLARIIESRPVARPGQLVAYHATSGGYVLAEVVKRATGKTIRTALRKHIADPLGLDWMSYGVAAERTGAIADDAVTGFPVLPPLSWFVERALGDAPDRLVAMGRGERFRTMINPSGNAVTTAQELARFFMCLADGGTLDGVRVWQPETVRRGTTEQSYYELMPLRWGVGVMLGDRMSIFGLNSDACFGHIGFTNMLAWADPDRKLGVALLNSGKPFLTPYSGQLGAVVQAITGAFPRAD